MKAMMALSLALASGGRAGRSTPVPGRALFVFAVGAMGLGLAHARWRADAREALRGIGIDAPAWWHRDLMRTLTLVGTHRARLPDGEKLHRAGVALAVSNVLWFVGGFVLLVFWSAAS
jgi:hypothetical protein